MSCLDQPNPQRDKQISPQYAFDRVIAPISVEQFLAEYYEQQILVQHREQPDYYSDLLTINTLDDFLADVWSYQKYLFVVNADREILPEEYTLAGERIDAVRLYQLYDEGATITFRKMQDKLPALGCLCRGAEQVFNCPFQTNLYFTPPGGQGFKTHHDTHDVFVLQVAGSKRWRTYEPVIPLPLTGQEFAGNEDRLGPVSEEFTLHAGDLFYCPRGVPHDARTTKEHSLHITFGALVNTWAEVMIEAMAGACLADPVFRTSLPAGYVTGDLPPAELEETFRGLVEKFSKTAKLGPAIEGIAEEFIATRRPMAHEQRRQIAQLDALTLDTQVGTRPGLIFRCVEADDAIKLHCHATEITFPRQLATALEYALRTPRFSVRDLPGGLDDDDKLVLMRRLIREGLVMTLSPG
jgi:hypothetical protein